MRLGSRMHGQVRRLRTLAAGAALLVTPAGAFAQEFAPVYGGRDPGAPVQSPGSCAAAQSGLGRPQSVRLNETWIEAQQRGLDVSDVRAVFDFVFGQLPDTVDVWPTENYYYFMFTANGRDYSGNLRLHPEDREAGLIHFAIFDTADPSRFGHALLGEDDGVTVRRRGALIYEVSSGRQSVTFRLNAIDQTDPGAPLIVENETFVGRSFDESGLIFLLVFNEAANRFLWVLDRDQPASVPFAAMAPDLEVHVPSGFVFWRSPGEERRLLVGVDADQTARNTYFDGPFDQLPDNWLAETQFREFAERWQPALAGRMNARGEFAGGEGRLAVTPYMQYEQLSEVWHRVKACDGATERVRRLACLLQ